MLIDQLRAKYQGYSDDEIIGALQATKYRDYSVAEIREAIGWKPQARNLMAVANDTLIEAANAVAGGVKAVGDFVSPGNAVSQFIEDKVIQPGWDSQSDATKAEKARLAQEVQESDGIGGEVGAALGYVARNPGLAAAQAVGSFVTPGAAIKGAGALGRLAGMTGAGAGIAGGVAAGAALSGGDAAGQAYELAKRAGASEEEAQDAARQASIIPAAVGGATGAFGAERVFAGAKGFAGSAASRALKTGASEAAQEAVEEGVTQYEGQRAAQPFDPSIDPMKGVASAATLGAALGGITGAGVSLLTRKRDEADQAMERLATSNDIDEITSAAVQAVDTPLAGPNSLMGATTSPGARQEREGLEFEADPRFAGAPTFRNGTAPAMPVFGSKQAADIYIGESGELGKLQAVEVAPGQWQAQQTPQAADATAQANIERWAERAEPMTEERATELARAALETQNRRMTPIPLPDGRGWTVVPSQWVQSPSLAGYVEQGRGAVAAEQQRNAGIRAEALAPAPARQMLPDLPGGRTWERDMAGITLDAEAARAEQQKAADLERLPADAAAQNLQQQALRRAAALEGESPMAAALRKAGAAGNAPAAPATELQAANSASTPAQAATQPRIVPRTPDMEPMSLPRAQETAAKVPGSEVVAIRNRSGKLAYTVLPPELAAIRPTDILTQDGFPYGTKTAATIRARKEGPEWRAVEVPGGFAVRKEQSNEPVSDLAGTAGLAAGAGDGRGPDIGGSQRDLGQLAADPGQRQQPAAGPLVRGSEQAVPVGDGGRPNTALNAAAPATKPAAVSESDAGAPSAPVAAAPIEGQKIDREWTAFAPDSGTLSIPRAEMPQIRAEHRGAMVNFLNARGIEHEATEVPAGELKPTQAEFSPAKVKKALEFTGGDRSILVSSDGHVLDGHHQWLAKRESGEPIKVIRLDAPIKRLLAEVREFPSAEASAGATEGATPSVREDGEPWQMTRDEFLKDVPANWKSNPEISGWHRVAVVRAIEDGKPVPAAVLAEYPDLAAAKQAPQATPQPTKTEPPTPRSADAVAKENSGASASGNAGPAKSLEQQVVADASPAANQEAIARQAAAILDAAAEPPKGKERLDVLKDVKAGAITPEEVRAAFPAAPKPERLTDAGEELIRNRRGKLKGLAWDDVSGMNDTLKVAQVVKGNVWPRPDYVKMVEDGAPAWKAAMLKAVYDKIAAAPVTRTTPTDADLKAYIETLHQVRDTLATELDRVAEIGGAADLWKTLKAANVFGKVFPIPTDARPVYGAPSPFDRVSAQGKENNRRALLIGGNAAVQALQFSHKTTSKVADLLSEGFPAKQEAWQKSYEVRQTDTRDNDVPEAERTGQPQQRFYVYEKGSRYRLAKGGQDGGYATQEQAEAFARSLIVKPRKEVLPPSRGLDLADAKRTGPDWREGKDVTASQVMSHFGFRGVNLGEYVKAKQGMAQLHLNHVFDAFSDLADLLGVPPKAMSLNGTLGVAIGAQGSGKALAHFVPGVNEINITRDSGAGALAHEFGHAVDHYFATQHGRATSMAKRPYLSAVVENINDAGGVRPEVMAAMRVVMKTINSRPMTEAEARKYMDDQRALNQRRLDRWSTEFKRNKGADPAALDAVTEKLKRGDIGEPQDTDVETNLAEFMRAAGLKPGNSIAANAFSVAYRLRDLADEARFMASHIPQVDTNYAKASAMMDAKKQGDGYWSTPWEKFARAFETFTMDALKDRQRESLYLSGLVDSRGWREWAADTGKDIPYPAGDERLAMQQAFQALVDTIQTREDDQGRVALFSRAPKVTTEQVDGVPTFATDQITIAYPQDIERFEVIPGAGERVVDYAIMPRDGFDVLGHVVLIVKDGVPTSLIDIEAYGQRSGVGRKVVEALLAANPEVDLNISNIVPAARGFWAKMGVPEQNVGQGDAYDGNLNWQAYSQARDEGAASRDAQTSRGPGEERDARAEGGRGGVEGQIQGLSRAEAEAILALPQATIDRLLGRRPGVERIRQMVAGMPGGIDVGVVQSVDDLPPDQRKKLTAIDSTGNVRGVYFPGSDKIWLIADHLHSEAEASFVLLHEAFHRGLAKTIGPDAKRLLRQMFYTNAKLRELTKQQMEAHGIERDEAIEEALADLAGKGEARDLKGWSKLVDMIRNWLSEVGQVLGIDIKWSDDMIADFVAGIRRAGMAEDVTINTPPGMRTHAQAERILKDAGYTVERIPEGAPSVTKGGKPADIKAMPKALQDAWNTLAVDDPAGGAPYTEDTRFSRTAQDLVAADGGVFDFNRLGATRQDRLRTVIDGTRPFWLGALTRDQIADIYGKGIPPVKEYDTLTRAMENQRSKIAQDADAIYSKWAKLGSAVNDKLARVMLDATVNSVHPDGEFSPIKSNDEATEAQRKAVHASISAEFKALPAEAQAMYRTVRDFHAGMLEQLKGSLEKRIERQVQDGKARAATLTNIRQMFDKYKEHGPYFPLSRFGDYLVIGNRNDGERVVASYETAGEQQTAARALRRDGFTVKTKTAKDYSRAMDGSAGKFAGDVLTMLNDLDMSEASIGGKAADLKTKLMDDVNQLFIRALPDLSYRKHFAHRKNTPGFSSDVMRGFASSAFHAASHIARLNHADQMSFALEDAYKTIDQQEEGDFNQQTQVLNELAQRHDASMNPNTHPIAAMLNQVGFVMYLGASPAAGLVNLLQTPMITLPYLGARHGFGKASAAMGKATKDIMGAKANRSSGWDAADSPRLTTKERETIRKLQDEGVIDLTQAHDLSAASGLDTGNVARSKAAFAMARAMKIVGWTFHVPEVMNRQVTALTAYRLEMEKSGDQAAAEEAAREAIKRTHFDYSSSNRARYMQGNVARVMLQFKQYSQNMTYLLGRAAHQAMKGETAEVRSIARRQLVATLASTFVMAGALGLPGLGAAAGLIGMMVGAMDDDDKPWDWKVEFRNLMADTVGKEAGEVLSHGLPRALIPWDLSSRVGMGDLWFRSNDKEGQSPREAFAEDLKNILGPTAGTLLGLYTASDHMARGNWAKAAESIVPKFVRDPIQAARMASEGVTSYSGEHLMDLTAAESLGKLLGFAPASVSEMYEGRNAVKNAETAVMEKRKRLIAQAAQARMQGDTEGAAEAMQDIAAFNRRNPREAIKGESIAASILARRRHERQTQDGTYLPKGRDHLREVGRFATAE